MKQKKQFYTMREVVTTKDGSHTIAIPEMKVTYHSIHGAIQESVHVFIDAGLNYLPHRSTEKPIAVFEMGFGTGLNAFLTAITATQTKTNVHYTSIEAFPLSANEIVFLNYPDILDYKEIFQQIHASSWNETAVINEYFTVQKINQSIQNYSNTKPFDLIYYDAFAPSAQPELWTKEVFEKLYKMLVAGGVLVTYCAKGDVRRAMMAAGFDVKKLPGPPGKREMLRGQKS